MRETRPPRRGARSRETRPGIASQRGSRRSASNARSCASGHGDAARPRGSPRPRDERERNTRRRRAARGAAQLHQDEAREHPGAPACQPAVERSHGPFLARTSAAPRRRAAGRAMLGLRHRNDGKTPVGESPRSCRQETRQTGKVATVPRWREPFRPATATRRRRRRDRCSEDGAVAGASPGGRMIVAVSAHPQRRLAMTCGIRSQADLKRWRVSPLIVSSAALHHGPLPPATSA